jgi:hypothetical protein
MNLLFILFLLLAQKGEAQIVSLTLCSDDACAQCTTTTYNAGQCYDAAAGSSLKIGSGTSIESLSFYSDESCKTVKPQENNMVLFMDGGCKTLYGANDKKLGSYKAINVSAIIGGVIGGVSVFAGFCLLVCCLFKDVKRRQRIEHLVAPAPGPATAPAPGPGPAIAPATIDDVIPVIKRTNINLSNNPFYSGGSVADWGP